MESITLIVKEEQHHIRLDKFLAVCCPEHSRSFLQQLVEKGHVTKDTETMAQCSVKVKRGETYQITIPEPESSDMKPAEHIMLDIAYEDNDMLVINKPAGMTVHPGAGNHDDTMANALLAHCGESLSGIGGVQRPGIVHRLDKDTSGLLVVAKNDKAHHHLSNQIAQRTAKRAYLALCWGVPLPHNGVINTLLDRHPKNRLKMAVSKTTGKHAITHYSVKEILGNGLASLVECRLETGRTHQIRVHLSHKKYPLIGDQTYGELRRNFANLPEPLRTTLQKFKRQALHSFRLGVEHPITSDYMEFRSEFPDDIKIVLQSLRDLPKAR